MQIVIDIPEESYVALMEIKDALQRAAGFEKFIVNGKPLPKGHGRLIDADELKTAFPTCDNSLDIKVASVRATINHAPTIIAADKESKE